MGFTRHFWPFAKEIGGECLEYFLVIMGNYAAPWVLNLVYGITDDAHSNLSKGAAAPRAMVRSSEQLKEEFEFDPERGIATFKSKWRSGFSDLSGRDTVSSPDPLEDTAEGIHALLRSEITIYKVDYEQPVAD